MKHILFLLFITSLLSCQQNNRKTMGDENNAAPVFIKSVEAIHNKSTWDSNNAVSFIIELSFNGEKRLNARVTSRTNSSQVRLDKEDGAIVIYDGDKAYLYPPDAEEENARFDVLSWQYFFALPFKLSDPGATLEILEQQKMQGNIMKRARLSFDNNTGDSPDDWYIIYQESDTGLLYGASYIVTLNRNKEEAEKNPHAIIYQNYVVEGGVPVPTRWTFHNWNEEDGFGEQIGEATISEIKFIDAEEELFEIPEDSKVLEK